MARLPKFRSGFMPPKRFAKEDMDDAAAAALAAEAFEAEVVLDVLVVDVLLPEELFTPAAAAAAAASRIIFIDGKELANNCGLKPILANCDAELEN